MSLASAGVSGRSGFTLSSTKKMSFRVLLEKSTDARTVDNKSIEGQAGTVNALIEKNGKVSGIERDSNGHWMERQADSQEGDSQ
jgi:hypothetical protein